MEIYVATDFGRAADAEAVASACREAGHFVVSRWHGHASGAEVAAARRVGGPSDRAAATAAAIRNVADLERAEVLIVLTSGELARGGRHFETGYAYRAGIPVVLIGPVEHAFHRLPGVLVATRDSLLAVLDGLASRPDAAAVAHRVANVGTDDLVFVEVQHGDYFGEADIERLGDEFGRDP